MHAPRYVAYTLRRFRMNSLSTRNPTGSELYCALRAILRASRMALAILSYGRPPDPTTHLTSCARGEPGIIYDTVSTKLHTYAEGRSHGPRHTYGSPLPAHGLEDTTFRGSMCVMQLLRSRIKS